MSTITENLGWLETFPALVQLEPASRTLLSKVARLVEAPLAEKILRGELSAGDVVLLGVEDGGLCFDTLAASSSAAQCSG